MNGLGIIVVVSFVILTIAIFTSTCTDWTYKECFKGSVTGVVADLPLAAPALAENNSLPYNDPTEEKSTTQMLNMLKADMDGFSSSELPGLMDVGKNDPSVKLPVTRFKGDYQRVKDELLTIDRNPGLEPHITIQDIQEMAANLRFLQRTYRTYSASNMVAPPVGGISTVGEGFTDGADTPITVDQLNTLSTKLSVEIARLLASGSTDPVIQARTNAFTKIRQTIDGINIRINNGTLDPKAIPIMTKDYQNFLPALGSNSAGIGGIISSSGNPDLSSLFNSYDTGDISGSDMAAVLFKKYAEDLLKGLSYKVTVGYTSSNEVLKEKAVASAWNAKQAVASMDSEGVFSEGNGTLHPGLDGFRGDFDKTVRSLDVVGFSDSVRPPAKAPTQIGSFDWKERADQITENIHRARLNPADYGCLEKGAQVSADYSWRGHAKMVCTRLATNSDPAVPEQMGCPPVSWKGWRV